MRIGAKTTLNLGIGAVRDGLSCVAGSGWLIGLPRPQDQHPQHPAGKARPGLPGHGEFGLIAVTFGTLHPPGGMVTALPVRWEPLAPGSECTVLLDGSIAVAPLPGHVQTTLLLAADCRLPPAAVVGDGYERARVQLARTARTFITSLAVTVANCAELGQRPLEPISVWLTGQHQTP